MHGDALFHAVLDGPDDDASRLVYADWLDENGGGARAEFIRVQVGLARLPDYDARRPPLARREAELIADHGAGWMTALPEGMREPSLFTPSFRRGFPAAVTARLQDFLDHAEGLFESAPVERVELYDLPKRRPNQALLGRAELQLLRTIFGQISDGPGEGVQALAACHALGRVRALGLGMNELAGEHLAALLASPHWPAGLRELDLHNNPLGAAGAEALAGCARLAGLRRLVVNSASLGPQGAAALFASPHLVGLRSLQLGSNDLGDDGARALAASPLLRRLEELGLGWNGVSAGALADVIRSEAAAGLRSITLTTGENDFGEFAELARALAAAPFAGTLRVLNLPGAALFARGLEELLASALGRGLISLDLSHQEMGHPTVRALAALPEGQLAHLDLSHCKFGDDGAVALADAAPTLAGVQTLHLPGNRIGPRGAEALANRAFPNLVKIGLKENPIGPEGAAALAGASWLPLVRSLDLWDCGIGDDGAEALASCAGLARLRVLALIKNQLTDRAALALAGSAHLARLRRLVVHQNDFSEKGLAALRQRFGDGLLFRPPEDDS